jgi:hypothetical protein
MAKSIDRKVLITGMIILGAIIVALIFSNSFNSGSMKNTISSTGQTTIKVMPDLVNVYFNVQTKALTADEASNKNSEIVAQMKSSLISLGFAEDEIKTQGFSVYPEYDWRSGTQKITGYAATHIVSVQILIEEKEKIGSALDAGISAGAGINYINYELTEEHQKSYKVDAIKAATEDATDKARALAEGAGQNLGRLVSISTNDYSYVPWMAYGTADSGGVVKSGAEIATSITPSEQEVSASVTAVFKIR